MPIEAFATPTGTGAGGANSASTGSRSRGLLHPRLVHISHDHWSLVMDSWTRQIRHCEPWRGMTSQEFGIHRDLVTRLASQCVPVAAVSPTDPGLVYGWICGAVLQPVGLQILHMVYVRSMYRQRGVATVLLSHLFPDLGRRPIHLTHWTRAARYHQARWQLKHNPYLAQA